MDALRHIYDKYWDDLVKVAACLLADLNSVEDCLQDVFLSLVTRATSLDVRGNLKHYLISSVVYQARAQLRHRRNRAEVGGADMASAHVAPTHDAMQIAMHREQAAALYRAMSHLPYEQREVITLHLHGQMTFQEIADQLDVSTNTMKSRYRYGLSALRSMLNAGAQS
jgi:RNA polymerase sigma-70 factor (ECF subfamily)